MRAKLMLVLGVMTVLTVGALLAGSSAAAPPANSTVTIRAQGTDLSGQVRSPAPNRCANNRTVFVMKQIGPRGGGNDIRFASDTTELQNGAYRWSTGNTGTAGRFYAKVFKNANCRGATSATIQVAPN
jgi:hypothetical protein